MKKVIAKNEDGELRFVKVVEEDTFGGDIRGQLESRRSMNQPLINELKERMYEIHCTEERLKMTPECVELTQVLFKLEEAKMWLDKYMRKL